MTTNHWTSNVPTTPGYYWVRAQHRPQFYIVELVRPTNPGANYLLVQPSGQEAAAFATDLGVVWSGPLAMPI